MNEQVRIAVSPEKLAELLLPESNDSAFLHRISDMLRLHMADMNMEEFLADALKMVARQNDDLLNIIIRLSRESPTPTKLYFPENP